MHRWITRSAILFLIATSIRVPFAAEPVSEKSELFFDLPLNGTINLDDTDGTIDVVGWYKPRVRLAIVRRAYTAERLQQIRVETKSLPDSLSIRTVISTIKGLFADRSGTIGYTLTVPEPSRLILKLANGEVSLQGLRGARAKVEVTNGRTTAINCFAEIEAHTTNGLMEISFDWWENLPASFNYVLGQGRMIAQLPATARFHVAARTKKGRIRNSFGFPAQADQNRGQTLTAGNGSNPIASLSMSADHGNISIETTR